MNSEQNTATFYGLGIAPAILDEIAKMKFTTPTPIQQKAIPIAIEGKDVMGIAQTGTGKTLAFGIPMIQSLLQKPTGRALVVVPTRELAMQVDETLRRLASPFHIGTVVLIGGMNMVPQIHLLRKNSTRILIATPGRLLDHVDQRTTQLSDIRVAVLDEADRMLDMGFAPAIHKIMGRIPKERQTLFFSATMPDEIVGMATSYMKLPLRVEIAKAGTAPEKISQELFIVKPEAKRQILLKILQERHGSVIVFTRTKANAKKTTKFLKESGHKTAEIHANRTLAQRKDALEGFKQGRYRILVATDIAARGIDVKGIEMVVNFDLPDDVDNYVHRIGRTGRAGLTGHAVSFATPDQRADVAAIERLTRVPLKRASHPDVPPAEFSNNPPPPKPKPGQRPFHHRPGGQGPHSGGRPRGPWRGPRR